MEIIFGILLFTIIYIYLGYPFILRLLATYFNKDVNKSDITPFVSLLIAAYNEERAIPEKIENCLSIDYPIDKLEIIVVSDGSDDRTNEIVEKYKDKRVILNALSPRRGKTGALNRTVPLTKGEIIVFSDANVMYRQDSLRILVKSFADDTVGAVTGNVTMISENVPFGKLESLYCKYERFLQLNESKFFSCIGVDGAMYAIRKELFKPPDDDVILDDFVISMNIARKGDRIIYESESISTEKSAPNLKQDFKRKIRIAAGAFQTIKKRQGLPRLTQGRIIYCYLSHKLLRWLSPFFLLGLFVSNLFLLGSVIYNLAFSIQLLFYFSAFMALFVPKRINLFYFPFYFCVFNAAEFIGFFKGILNRQPVKWDVADR